MMDPAQQLAGMTKRYNLSADQQNQVKPILVDQQQQMLLLHLDSSLSLDEKKAKMQNIRSDSDKQIAAILNDDQKRQFEQDHRSTYERMQQRDQDGGPGGSGPPPQQ
jgi:Na+-transporting NADH:ubiquinone oxidoreductase subunit NqrC